MPLPSSIAKLFCFGFGSKDMSTTKVTESLANLPPEDDECNDTLTDAVSETGTIDTIDYSPPISPIGHPVLSYSHNSSEEDVMMINAANACKKARNCEEAPALGGAVAMHLGA